MYLKDSKTVVVKIGSSLLIDKDKKIRVKWLSEFAKDGKRCMFKHPGLLDMRAELKRKYNQT